MSFNAPPQQQGFNAPPGAQQGFNAPPGSQGEGTEVYHGGVVREEQPIRAGQFIAAQNQTAFLYLNQEGNLVLYSDRTFKNKIWESHTANKGDAPHQAKLTADGTLQVLDRNMKPTFTVKLQGKATAPHKLVLQNDRNLVIYDRNLAAIYSVNAEKTNEKFEHELAVETKKLQALQLTETAAEKHLHKLQQDLAKLQKEVHDQEAKVNKEKQEIANLNKKIEADKQKQAQTVQQELAATKEPQQQGFNAPPQQQQGGFNAPPQQGGFNAPPQQAGFNAPPQQGGFNAPPK